jgi:hypothetical protein
MLSRKVAFSKVMIVIGHEGIPRDVKVVSVSKLARESGRSEATVMNDLRASGHRLMVPSTLEKALDERERELLNGSAASPVRIRGKPGTIFLNPVEEGAQR